MESIVLESWGPGKKSWVSELKGTEVLMGTREEIFTKLYERNRELRYCNGSFWKLQDPTLKPAYEAFYKKHNTIKNYYGGGTVD